MIFDTFKKSCCVALALLVIGGSMLCAQTPPAKKSKLAGDRGKGPDTGWHKMWRVYLRKDPAWYSSAEAARIADNLMLFQRMSGGWPKNVDMTSPLDEAQRAAIAAQKNEEDTTIDNQTSYTQIEYLARVYQATRTERFRAGFNRGVDFLLAGQYANGGWPQFFPNPEAYQQHITFNDDAMIGVMNLLRDIAERKDKYAFVDAKRRTACARAVRKGIECILQCQVVSNSKRLAWGAQHDRKTLQPAAARTYELPSLSGNESVGLVRFLMSLDKPDRRIIEAVTAATAWLEAVKLTGIKVIEEPDPTSPTGKNRVVVNDPAAPPLWARFYELGTNRPFFSGRDGIVKYSLAEIESERRNNYGWYGDDAADLLSKEYPVWRARWVTEHHAQKNKH